MDDLETRRTEDRLRVALRARAARIDPPNRLDDILEAVDSGRGGRRWLQPLAAAAAVLAVVGGLWAATAPDAPIEPAPAASSPTQPAPTTPAPSASPTPSPTPSATPTGPLTSVPVYLITPELPSNLDRGYGLRRSWLPTSATLPEDRIRAAVDEALDADVVGLDVSPWVGVDVTGVAITADRLDVTLSGRPRGTGLPVGELALAQVGWTAQAVHGAGNVPVRVLVDGAELGVVTRPPAEEWWSVLTDIWVTEPRTGQTLSADRPVTVRGEASVFEAALSWELEGPGGTATGFVTASAGAPARGTYEIDLGELAAGTYEIRVRSFSAKDGEIDLEDVVTFEVR